MVTLNGSLRIISEVPAEIWSRKVVPGAPKTSSGEKAAPPSE